MMDGVEEEESYDDMGDWRWALGVEFPFPQFKVAKLVGGQVPGGRQLSSSEKKGASSCVQVAMGPILSSQ